MNILLQKNAVKFPFESMLSDVEKKELWEKSNIVKYNNKDIIFKQNTRTSHIMLITRGLVKIYKETRNNKNHILELADEGNYIGLLSIFGDEVFQYSAAAVENTEICFIDINVFKNVIHNNGKYAVKILQTVSQKGLFIFTKLVNQVNKQLPGRIADVLLYFAEVIYKNNEFVFPVTRKELAELAGTTKESFIRTLTEFKNDKIIALDGNHVKIISIDIIKTLHELG